MRKKKSKDFREIKKRLLREKFKDVPLDKKIEEAISLSELCQELKREMKNAGILSKDS